MSDAEETAAHGHDEIHMPPNSWAPLATAASLTVTMAGLGLLRTDTWKFIFPIGLVALVLSIGGWIWAATREHSELH